MKYQTKVKIVKSLCRLLRCDILKDLENSRDVKPIILHSERAPIQTFCCGLNEQIKLSDKDRYLEFTISRLANSITRDLINKDVFNFKYRENAVSYKQDLLDISVMADLKIVVINQNENDCEDGYVKYDPREQINETL